MTKIICCLTVAISTLFYSCAKKNVAEPLALGKRLAPVKKVYIPKVIWNVPANNDYNNDASLYSNQRKAESADFVAFWAKDFGPTPATNTDPNKRFDITQILTECERFFQYYADTLKFVDKGRSVSDSLKALIYVTNSTDGTAYGGGAENKVGILWVTPPRINTYPFGAVAHELGHVFQYYVQSDGNWAYSSSPQGSNGQTIFEMTSQYMLWQVYPQWLTFENYHLQAFMKYTNYAFLHEINHTTLLLYWSTGLINGGRILLRNYGKAPDVVKMLLPHINGLPRLISRHSMMNCLMLTESLSPGICRGSGVLPVSMQISIFQS